MQFLLFNPFLKFRCFKINFNKTTTFCVNIGRHPKGASSLRSQRKRESTLLLLKLCCIYQLYSKTHKCFAVSVVCRKPPYPTNFNNMFDVFFNAKMLAYNKKATDFSVAHFTIILLAFPSCAIRSGYHRYHRTYQAFSAYLYEHQHRQQLCKYLEPFRFLQKQMCSLHFQGPVLRH